MLIKDITVEKLAQQRQLSVHIRWHGGASIDLSVPLPPKAADQFRYPSAIVERVRDLAHDLRDGDIADRLNQDGHATAKGKPYTTKIVQWIRWRYRIPPTELKKPEELTVGQVVKHFGVSESVVYYWLEHKVIEARRLNAGMPYWITLNAADEQKLRDWVCHSFRIRRASPTPLEDGAL